MTSYLRYKKELRTVQDADDIESWITVRGNHIPIKKGESKEDAVKSFLEKKDSSKKESSVKLSKGMTLKFSDGSKQTIKSIRSDLIDTEKSTHTAEKLIAGIKKGDIKVEKPESKAEAKKESKKQINENFEKAKSSLPKEKVESYLDKIGGINKKYDRLYSEASTKEEKEKILKEWSKNGNEVVKEMTNEAKETSEKERKLSNGGTTIGLTQKEHNKIENHNQKVGKLAEQYKTEGKNASEFLSKLENKDPETVKKFVSYIEKGFGKNSPEAQKAREKYGIKTENEESSKKWSGAWSKRANKPVTLGEASKNAVEIVKKEKELNSAKKEQNKEDESWGGSYPKFNKLTDKYMPKTGESDNELGEMLRSINRVAYRYYNDGDMWNKGYGKETVNWAVKHLTELAKNKNTPRHIARGLENGLFEMKKYGIKDKDRYETSLKILMQTVEFANQSDIDALAKIKRSTKKATDSWHRLWGKK